MSKKNLYKLYGFLFFLSLLPLISFAQSNKTIHVVRVGETLSGIATKYGISVDVLCQLNGKSCKDLFQEITIGSILTVKNDTVETPPSPEEELSSSYYSSPTIELEAYEQGKIVLYNGRLIGRPLASGELYDPNHLTVSHRSLPFDTIVLLTNLENGQATFARVNDRGPLDSRFIMDASEKVIQALELGARNSQIKVEIVRHY